MEGTCLGLEVRFRARPDGGRLAYATLGSGPPLVWVPGWISHLEAMWERAAIRTFFERLAASHTVILYDKYGVGLSDRDRADFTLQSEVTDLASIVGALDERPATVVGHSQAGAVAATYAAQEPGRVGHLILHGAWAHIGDRASAEARAAILSVVQSHWGMGSTLLADLFDPTYGREDREWLTRFQRRSADASTALRLLELCYELDVRDILPRVRTATLVLHRKDDRIAWSDLGRELASLIGGARFVLMDGRAHYPWDEDPDTVLSAIGSFLDVPTARPATSTSPKPSRAVLRCDGDVWRVGSGDGEALLKDVKGLRYLAELLARPGAEAHVIELVAAVEGAEVAGGLISGEDLTGRLGPDGDLGPFLDRSAREAYERRLGDLREELDDAERANDGDRATAIRAESDALTEQLAAAFGLGGRQRPSGATAERARVKVTRLIKDAIRRIDAVDPQLGHLLSATVRTGTYCVYEPPPDGGPRWEL